MKAVGIVLLAIFLMDVQGALIKLMAADYPIEQIAFYRNLFGLIPPLLLLLFSTEWHQDGSKVFIKRWKLAVSRGLSMAVAQLCYYTSLKQLELATAVTLLFAGPLFSTILSIPLFGHRVGFYRILAVVLGFLGVIVVVRPGGDEFSLFMLLPVIAALFYALANISSRYFDQDASTALISVYASCAAAAAALILVLVRGETLAPQTSADWLYFVPMGLTGGFAIFLLATAYRMIMPSSLSPFEYFGIPFSFLLGWIFFDETPFDSLFPGALFIVAGGLLVVWKERK